MRCKNCGIDITDTEINATIVLMAGMKEAIDITIDCPECEEQHYTFVPISDLITQK